MPEEEAGDPLQVTLATLDTDESGRQSPRDPLFTVDQPPKPYDSLTSAFA